ncbi:DUF4249 domain-containing protein [Hymenobacter aquaticus]|uniref:DUF4249 domain-containing protein n=1 Tax=Hymenobacter aquaticus TaxID=1867101 RepID=A0A4Z0Q2Y7_9BACT|nr:DUF4249 domain-containing protein [Hymenobacter aquaticus]TGE24065.1 DUF4249 domain-containing protein [Hymenobacter aquaticus]
MTRYIHLRSTVRLWSLLLLSLTSCIDPFEPEVNGVNVNFLVVDGFINASGVTTIKLTRTLNLQANTPPPVESKATVYVEEENGQRYRLTESPAGTYTSPNLQLNVGKRHRLHFTTAASKEYFSDYTAVKLTPPIDKVTWTADEGGVHLFVSAHDDANKTQYYRWDYDETWEFTSQYRSYFEFVGGKMQYRTNNIWRCWTGQLGGFIRLSTTTKLNQDVVADYPLANLPSNSTKLRYKYSVLVKQYAQTQEEFAYWEEMRKNTESIGTLFDPLPTQLVGNMHCATKPDELVLGYVGGYSVSEKRIFISRDELPASWQFETGYKCGVPDTIQFQYAALAFNNPNFLPIEMIEDVGYTGLTSDCVDCRKRGTNVAPSFWK